MNLEELSILNIGFILNGNYNPSVYNPDHFPAPYNKAIKALQDNKDCLASKSDADTVLTSILRLEEIETAHEVAARQNGLGEVGAFNWPGAQAEAYERWAVGSKLEPVVRDLRANKPVDLLPIFGTLQSMIVGGGRSGLKPSGEIDESNYTPYMKCGYKPIDDIIGGIPTDGPIITVGEQGVGKSYWMYNLVCSWLGANPDKKAAIYTLEMPAEHYKWRNDKMYPEFKYLHATGRLLISGSVKNITELVAEVSASGVGMVGIDDIDGLVEDENPAAYQKVFKKVKEICRFLGIPVIVLAQPSREKKQKKEFLGIYAAQWSGAAENSAAMMLTLNKVNPADPEWQDTRFPTTKGNPNNTPRFYMCFWKFRENRDDDKQSGIGAIRIEPGANGFYKQIWKGEAFENKLWTPNYGQRNIGTSQKSDNSGSGVRFSKHVD